MTHPGERAPLGEADVRLLERLRRPVADGFDYEPDSLCVAAAKRIEELLIALGTEQTMHAAWRKRAEEAERISPEASRGTAAVEGGASARPTFREDLRALLNRRSMENGSNTPDFLLADYLTACLVNFDNATALRDQWYGHGPRIAEVLTASATPTPANAPSERPREQQEGEREREVFQAGFRAAMAEARTFPGDPAHRETGDTISHGGDHEST